MVKFTILLIRKPELTHAEFVRHHKDIHAPLFTSIAVVRDTVRRYVQQHAVPADLPGLPPSRFDGVTELWFDDVQALARCFTDAEYLETVRPDEAAFLDLHACEFIVTAEHAVTG